MNLNFKSHTLRDGCNGYYLETDRISGKTIFEADLLQCGHCAHTWKHIPGSGIRRGICTKCDKPTCGKPACDTHYDQRQWVDDVEAVERRNRAAIEAAVRLHDLKERLFS